MASDSMASDRKVGHGAVWAVLGQGTGQVLSLLLFLVIARFVSKESFGLVSVSLATIEVARRVLIDPLTQVVTAKPGVTDRDFNFCFFVVVVVAGTLALILFFGAPWISAMIGTPAAADTLHILSAILLAFGLSATHGAWLVRGLQFRALALRSVASVIAGGVVGIGMALNGYDLWSLVGQQLTIQTVSVITLWYGTSWRPTLAFSWREGRGSVGQAAHIATSAIWTSIALDADIFFASAFFGLTAAGVYNAGKRIMLAANMLLVNTISAVAMPTFANIGRHQDRGPAFLNGLRLTSAMTAPAFAGMAATAPLLVRVILGERWSDVSLIITALAASGYALSIGQFATSILLVQQRPHLDSLTSAVAAIVNVTTFFMVLRFGPVALAATVSATTIGVLPVRLRFAMRELGIRWGQIVQVLLPSLVAAGVMATVLIVIRAMLPALPPPLGLGIQIPLGMACYALAMRLVSPALFQESSRAVGQLLKRRRVSPS